MARTVAFSSSLLSSCNAISSSLSSICAMPTRRGAVYLQGDILQLVQQLFFQVGEVLGHLQSANLSDTFYLTDS